MKQLTVVCILLCLWSAQAQTNYTFPSYLQFGVATAAYQIEGAWNESGKGPSIWDNFTQQVPSPIQNGDNGNIACDSYNKFREDVALAAALGVQFYRFSISWPRILPTGYNNEINLIGIEYYKNLTTEIIAHNMTPMATLYHWDLPQTLQDEFGGLINESLVEIFVNYSRVAFANFPEVEYWITFNEPRIICNFGYGSGLLAPGIPNSGVGDYQCAYVILKAHAETYHMFKTEFSNSTAKIAMVFDGQWSEPASSSPEDIEAAERKLQFEVGLYAHPIFVGNWPESIISRVAVRSALEGTASRLPVFTPDEISRIQNTTDFFALNSYMTYYAANAPEANVSQTSFENDVRATTSVNPDWATGSNGSPVVGWGLRRMLNWIKNNYNNPEILITENGVADNSSDLNDVARINYYTEYMTAVLESIYEDQVNITAYTAWSLLDNFEWIFGYSQRFGLHHVDFESENRTRTPKASASFYSEVIRTRQLPQNNTPVDPNSSEKSAVICIPLLVSFVMYFLF